MFVANQDAGPGDAAWSGDHDELPSVQCIYTLPVNATCAGGQRMNDDWQGKTMTTNSIAVSFARV